jgi:hypothetical protein
MTEEQIDLKLEYMGCNLWLRSAQIAFLKTIETTIGLISKSAMGLLVGLGSLAQLATRGCLALLLSLCLLGYVIRLFGNADFWRVALIAVLIVASVKFCYYLLEETAKTRSLRMWEWFFQFFSSIHVVPTEVEAMHREIATLYESDESTMILSLNQSARLLNIYHCEQERIIEVNHQLKIITGLTRGIEERVAELRDLREKNLAGEQSLKELKKTELELSKLKDKLNRSQGNIHSIIYKAKDELKARRLHRELNSLAEVALTSAFSNPLPELIGANPAGELEELIKMEIDIYLDLETDARRCLDNIQMT